MDKLARGGFKKVVGGGIALRWRHVRNIAGQSWRLAWVLFFTAFSNTNFVYGLLPESTKATVVKYVPTWTPAAVSLGCFVALLLIMFEASYRQLERARSETTVLGGRLAALEARLTPRIEWSFEKLREQAWYHKARTSTPSGNVTLHFWRLRVTAPTDAPLEGVRVFTEGARFLPWIELEVMGLPGEGEVTIPGLGHRFFNLLLEMIHDDGGRSELRMPYAKADCGLREPPLEGTLHITAKNTPSVIVPFWIIRDTDGMAVPSFEQPLVLAETTKEEPSAPPQTSADEG